LILIPAKGEGEQMVLRSTRNLPGTKVLLANYLNVRDLLGYDKVVLPVSALDVISSYLGK
jgi:large subunit ribosomal protein L4